MLCVLVFVFVNNVSFVSHSIMFFCNFVEKALYSYSLYLQLVFYRKSYCE